MKQIILAFTFLAAVVWPAAAQAQESKFIADTVVVQAEGTYETDPDLATLTFDITSQEKDLKQAYDKATQSMQRITALAEQSGLKKEDVTTGVLTVTPFYGGDRNRKARSFLVRGQMTLKVHDFSKIGPVIDGSVEEGIVDYRSLKYSLADEEAAKEKAIAQAVRRAAQRATAALAERGQKPGVLRYANVDVKQLGGVARFEPTQQVQMEQLATISIGATEMNRAAKAGFQSFPAASPGKITVSATVQCAFQIQ